MNPWLICYAVNSELLLTKEKIKKFGAELSLKYIVKQLGYKNEKIAYDALRAHGATLKKNKKESDANSAYSLDTLKSSKIYTKQFVFKVMDGDNVDESR